MHVEVEAYLIPPIRSKLDPMIRDELVNVSILVSFGLGMANQDYHLSWISISVAHG